MKNLSAYKAKRKLKESPEPQPRQHKSTKNAIFVIQKHAASHLHYDFRLEVEGTLKSWAVPKGPSLNPSIKRLAIMVEDHPFDYKDFEGTIPKGNYGAGTVMIWDFGTYHAVGAKSRKESEKLMIEGLKKGHVDIQLQGKKLSGAFTLVKTHLSSQENSWLLIKKKDDSASTKDILTLDLSAKTDRSMEEIAEGKKQNSTRNNLKDFLAEAPKARIPTITQPMLATLTDEAFDRKNWLFEIKWDGYRSLATIKKGKVKLESRNHNSFNSLFPLIVDELSSYSNDAILDGEIVILDKQGKTNFQLMQNYQRNQEGRVIYYVFDLLYLNGHDLRKLPLFERKVILKQFLEDLSQPDILYSDHIEDKGKAFFKAAKKLHLEGIMAKDGQSSYQMKRSNSWLKIKTHLEQEFVIGGFTQPRGSRSKFGALLLGVYKEGKLHYAGHVGGGFTEDILAEIYDKLIPLIQDHSPFTKTPKPNTQVTWVKPKLICQVSFAEWTSDNILRQPIFKGLRIDKKPSEVKREYGVSSKTKA